MVAASPFGSAAGLIDQMIGEEYAVVKAVAERIPDLDGISQAVDAAGGLVVLVTGAQAAKDDAETAATNTATDRELALGYKNDALASKNSASSSAIAAAVLQLQPLAQLRPPPSRPLLPLDQLFPLKPVESLVRVRLLRPKNGQPKPLVRLWLVRVMGLRSTPRMQPTVLSQLRASKL
jgi:hypothetical protein